MAMVAVGGSDAMMAMAAAGGGRRRSRRRGEILIHRSKIQVWGNKSKYDIDDPIFLCKANHHIKDNTYTRSNSKTSLN